MANANAFDKRRVELRRDALSALDALGPASGGSSGKVDSPSQKLAFEKRLRDVRQQ